MRDLQKTTEIKEKFVVAKNNDIKFTFGDRSVLYKNNIHRHLALATAPVQ